MLKLADKLRILALCLSLFVGITLMLSAEANTVLTPPNSGAPVEKNEGAEEENKNDTNENVTTEEPKTTNVIVPDNKGTSDTTPPVVKQPDSEKETDSEKATIDNASQKTEPLSQSNLGARLEPQPVKDDEFFHIIVIAFGIVLLLLIIVGFIMIKSDIKTLYERLEQVEKKSKKSKDNASSESEDFMTSFTKRPENNSSYASQDVGKLRDLEKRITQLEAKVDNLLQAVDKLWQIVKSESFNPPRKEDRTTDSMQRPQRDFYRKDECVKNMPHLLLSSTGKESPVRVDTQGQSLGMRKSLQWSSDIQKIIAAFNEMMRETKGLSVINARQKFISDYKVTTFKCINSEERVNHPEVSPRFASCAPSDSSLWGVALLDGTLVVLPGLREYESIAHNQGGLKEIFDTGGYKNGTYRKIEVIKAALMTRDFQLIEQGKLSLSQY